MGGKGKPICLVSFISFKCSCNAKIEFNNLRWLKKKKKNLLPIFLTKREKTKQTAPFIGIQNSAGVCLKEVEAGRNTSVATVKHPSANFHDPFRPPPPNPPGQACGDGRVDHRGWSLSRRLMRL